MDGHGRMLIKATKEDLSQIIELLVDDELGKERESLSQDSFSLYERAFIKMDQNPDQMLMVFKEGEKIIGVCELTFVTSLTFQGSTRLLIEGVRIAKAYRNQGYGSIMIQEVLEIAKSKECTLIELTTNKSRKKAQSFYKKLGFEPSHEGFKYDLTKRYS